MYRTHCHDVNPGNRGCLGLTLFGRRIAHALATFGPPTTGPNNANQSAQHALRGRPAGAAATFAFAALALASAPLPNLHIGQKRHGWGNEHARTPRGNGQPDGNCDRPYLETLDARTTAATATVAAPLPGTARRGGTRPQLERRPRGMLHARDDRGGFSLRPTRTPCLGKEVVIDSVLLRLSHLQ